MNLQAENRLLKDKLGGRRNQFNPERAFLAKGQRYSAMPHVDPSCYDYPRYYDLAFRSETRAEVEFIEAVCRSTVHSRFGGCWNRAAAGGGWSSRSPGADTTWSGST